MQQRIVAMQQEDKKEFGDYEHKIKVFQELTITEILKDNGRVSGAYGYWRESGDEVLFEASAVVLATGGF
jgi:succinate dehydrogenase / fumarate reductase flavoprotein subunit